MNKALVVAMVMVAMVSQAQTNPALVPGGQEGPPVTFEANLKAPVHIQSTLGGITNFLSLVTSIEVDAGMACHFDDMTVLYPSTGQNFNLWQLDKGSWTWKFAITHSDTFFDDGIEDEFGPSVSVWHFTTPTPVNNAIDTIKPRSWLDTHEFNLKLGVFNATTKIFNGDIESGSMGLRLVASFAIGQ